MGIYKGAGLLRLDEVRQVPGRDRLGGDAPAHGAQLHARRPGGERQQPEPAQATTPTTSSSSRPSSSTASTSTAMADVWQWYWEVWNEPDYAGFWTGTMADYYTLYDNAVDAITAVIPNAIVGGPSTTEPQQDRRLLAALQDREQARHLRLVSRLPGRRRGGRGGERHRPVERQQHPAEPDHQRRLHDDGGEVVQHRMELVVQRPGRPDRRRRHRAWTTTGTSASSSRASSCSPT